VRAVVDASVIVAGLVDTGRDGRWAEAQLAAGEVAGPELALAESSNVLRRLEAAGVLSRFEAATAHQDLLELDIALFPFAPFAERVWALRANLTSYDGWYVALAESLGCPLATLDGRLTRAAGPTCRFASPPPEPD